MLPWLHDAIGPGLGLVGTLAVAVLGYRQWKRQQELARYGGLLGDKQQAYKAAWEKLEAVYLYVRTESYERSGFNGLMRDANLHLMQTGLLLDPGEKGRLNAYLEALRELGVALAGAEAGEARESARETMYVTGEVAPDVLRQVPALQVAYANAERHRELAMARFRRVLGAHLQ